MLGAPQRLPARGPQCKLAYFSVSRPGRTNDRPLLERTGLYVDRHVPLVIVQKLVRRGNCIQITPPSNKTASEGDSSGCRLGFARSSSLLCSGVDLLPVPGHNATKDMSVEAEIHWHDIQAIFPTRSDSYLC